MTVTSGKSKVGVGVMVGVSVIVGVGVFVGVSVMVGVKVGVGVSVGVAVYVAVGVSVGVGVGVANSASGALQLLKTNANARVIMSVKRLHTFAKIRSRKGSTS